MQFSVLMYLIFVCSCKIRYSPALISSTLRFVNLPRPELWSEEGPVEEDGVAPLRRVQSNVSFLSCVKPHIEVSKLQATPIEKNDNVII